jgi:hypothetical protein
MPVYPTPPGDSMEPVAAALKDTTRRLREVERPGATQLGSLVAQVQAALANINATVAAAIAANSYTRAQTDAKVASPGAISPTTVSASGAVSAASLSSSGGISAAGGVQGATGRFDGGLYATDAYSFNITGTRVAGWHQIDGHIATASSSERFKTNIVDAGLIEKAEAILGCQIAYYTYKAEIAKRDDPTSPEYIGPDYKVHTEVGMIAERLHEAGLWEFVVYERDVEMKDQVDVDDEGNETIVQVYAGDTLRLNELGEPIPYSIHYEIFSLGVLAATQYLYGLWKTDHEQLEQNTADIAALRKAIG